MKNLILITIVFIATSIAIKAQTESLPSWISPNRVHNFYEIQADFNRYWEGKNITPETPRESRAGWKQFKRWEWFWEQRVTPSGKFPTAGHAYDEYLKYRANNLDKKTDKKLSATWSFLGPTSASGGYEGLGRLNCVVEDPNYNGTTNRTIWAGAASGGIWKTTNGGANWTTNTDDLAVLGIADIVIDPNNSNIMYAASGDGDAYDTYSIGVLKSTDAGQTWALTGYQQQITNYSICRRMIMSHGNSSVLIVATNDGLYRTTDAGSNWSLVQSGGFYDVKMHPTNANIVYATTGSAFFRSTNGGANWSNITSGLATSSSRYAIAVTPASSNYVYVLSANSSGAYNGIYRSIDSGLTFASRSTTPNILSSSSTGTGTSGQGWYDLALTVDPLNADNVYVGGVNIWKSTNGGTNWTLRTYWTYSSTAQEVHADHHMMYFGGTNRLYSAHDGGLDVSTNGGSDWSYISNGLQITQFYRISSSQTNANNVLCGAQDNSSFLKTQSYFNMTKSTGDGMDQAINPSNGSIMFTSSYYGSFYRSTNTGDTWSNLSVINDDGGWITPYVIDPNNHTTLFAGFKKVWKSTDNGATWAYISSFSNTNTLTYIHVAPANSSYIYAGRSGAMWRTTNGGTNWTTVTLPNSSISSIASNNSDPNEVWVSTSGYTSGSKVFHSTNGGANWTNVSGSLPNVPCNIIIFQPNSDNRVWVGTDIGVWYRGTSDANWVDYNDGLPNVICADLDIYTAGNKLRVGTYGRGLWESALPGAPNSPPELVYPANNQQNVVQNPLLSWNQTSSAVSYRVQVSLSSTFTSFVSNSLVTTTSKQLNGLSFSTVYYWRVRAISATDSSAWTTTQNFTVRIPLFVPTLISPANQANIANDSIEFVWSKDVLATNCRLQVATDPQFSNLLTNKLLYDTNSVCGPYPTGSKYYWRVKATNSSYESDWTTIREFTNELYTTVPIGTGTQVSYYPFFTFYHDATSYFLYKKSEIIANGGSSGMIASLAFRILSTNPDYQAMNSFRIFMQTTNQDTVPLPLPNNWTMVYSAPSFIPFFTGWVEFAFDNKYLYNGNDNILFKICFNNTGYTDYSSVYATNVPGTTYCLYEDNGIVDGCSADMENEAKPYRPNIKLLMSPEFKISAPTLLTPENSAVDIIANPSLIWELPQNASSYRIQVSTSNTFATLLKNEVVNAKIIPLNGLSSNTMYYWRVCAKFLNDSSLWSPVFSFKTETGIRTQNVQLVSGWNMISANVEPSNPAMAVISAPLGTNLQQIKNAYGKLFAPPFQNSLNLWNTNHAYQVRMNTSGILPLEGIKIIPETSPIVLNQLGWYWLPYFRTSSMSPATALASITGKYLQIKNIQGQVYQPPYSNTLTQLEPNSGYMLRVTNASGVLTYPANAVPKAGSAESVISDPNVFVRQKHITGKTAFIALELTNAEAGDEIGVFTLDGMLVGSSVWGVGSQGVVVWGDDEFTIEKDGAAEGEELIVKIWSNSNRLIGKVNPIALQDMSNEKANFTLAYETDGILLLKGTTELAPESFLYVSPQPASDELSVYINIPSADKSALRLFNINGQQVAEISSVRTGETVKINTNFLPSGVYQLILTAGENTYSERVAIVR